jgi:dCTP deaminase
MLALEEALDGRLGAAPEPTTGILPYQTIGQMIREREIISVADITPDQLQPASLDLRLGKVAYRVKASFLPGPDATVMDKIKQLDGYEIDISSGAVLEKGCVYVIPLLESLKLRGELTALANPKSSIGRIDVLTRLITDRSAAFDKIERGYAGPLYLEVAPRTFSVVVKTGARLNQLRFRRGSPVMAANTLEQLYDEGKLVLNEEGRQGIKEKMVPVTIDLKGNGTKGLSRRSGAKAEPIGYRAKKHTDRIDLEKIGYYDPLDFWEPITHRKDSIILNPDDFYILATREFVRVPPDFAAEMVAYDTTVGEFRVHYAGFFDPGFGDDASGKGSKAVLEVRSHEVPFVLEHAQIIGWLRYERMAGRPERLYGSGIGSNYQNQGLALAKQFKPLET